MNSRSMNDTDECKLVEHYFQEIISIIQKFQLNFYWKKTETKQNSVHPEIEFLK